MKTLKALCTAAILALALSVPAYAGDGDLGSPGYTPPPPPLNITVPTATSSTPGDMGTPTSSALADLTPGFADILWVLALDFLWT